MVMAAEVHCFRRSLHAIVSGGRGGLLRQRSRPVAEAAAAGGRDTSTHTFDLGSAGRKPPRGIGHVRQPRADANATPHTPIPHTPSTTPCVGYLVE